MNIILFSRGRGRTHQLCLRRPAHVSAALLVVISLVTLPFIVGFFWSQNIVAKQPYPEIRVLEQELVEQKQTIRLAKENTQEDLDAMAIRLGQMQAHVIRLDALGRRLTQMAGLEDGEFNFDIPPAQGGPAPTDHEEAGEVPDLLALLDTLEHQVENRGRQLSVLENVLMDRNLSQQVHPGGRPVNSGYISSYFGYRNDPFTGRKAWHNGLDFAGREGAEVIAVAAGVVTWSGDRYGYGTMVEINHGSGYVTRYAHNKQNLVGVGDKIEKGQPIAVMGSTGRATGPNLHFEVLHNGRVVNPRKYLQ